MEKDLVQNVLDEWDDDDFGIEYAKFKEADPVDSALYDDNVDVLYCVPDYESITSYINMWNKSRKRIRIKTIIRAFGTPYDSDRIEDDGNLHLDMGARLYNSLKLAHSEKYKFLKIIKISNPNDKFDVHYYASQYNLVEQTKLVSKKSKKK